MQPNSLKTITIEFIPTDTIKYCDKITFFSNAATIDSIATFCGKGAAPNSVSESPENIKSINYIKNIEPSPIGTEDARLDLIISQEGFAEIKIINIDGEVVKTLINQNMYIGEHSVKFSVNDLTNGIYMVWLNSS